MRINIDFHIHSKYAGGTSSNMELPLIAEQAVLKGLNVVGTGDALNSQWREHIKKNTKEVDEGIYSTPQSATKFIITTEVEDKNRVHHIILLPSVSSAEDLYERIKKYSSDIDKDGRAHVNLDGCELVDYVAGADGMAGPAHAFTPWTSLYKEHNSIKECYGSNMKHVKFIELGLSADTYMADRIKEIADLTFMSNSDAHSPWPNRLGREFNRLDLEEISFKEIRDAIEKHKFVLNVGLNPKEGKYHLTACARCFMRFRNADAEKLKWRCPECRGMIKKGVDYRISELADFDEPVHPPHRPPYIHIVPLAEIISMVKKIKSVQSKSVSDEWNRLVKAFGTEINILIDAETEEIKKVDPKIGEIIERFRSGRVEYDPGGGGRYGAPLLGSKKEDIYWRGSQTMLGDF